MKHALQAIEHPSFGRLHNIGYQMPFHLLEAVLGIGFLPKKLALLQERYNPIIFLMTKWIRFVMFKK